MRTIKGIDTDNYDGIISVERFRRLYVEEAIRFNILGLEAGMPYVDVQKANGEAVGITTRFGYKFLYWQADDLTRLADACRKQLPIAVDIEYGSGMPGGFDATITRMHQARELLMHEGLFWGWYSSVEEWRRLTNSTMVFAGDRGWCANYPYARPNEKVLPPAGYVPDLSQFSSFGGTTLDVLQYSDCVPGEMDFDANAIEEADPLLQRHNAEHGALRGAQVSNATLVRLDDFDNPPPACRQVRLELFLLEGNLLVKDGNGGLYAGQAGWGGVDADPPAYIDVNVVDRVFTLEGTGTIAQLGIIGYFE